MDVEKMTKRPVKMAAYIWGITFIAVGVIILLRKLFFVSLAKLFPITLIAVGIVLILSYLYHHKKAKL